MNKGEYIKCSKKVTVIYERTVQMCAVYTQNVHSSVHPPEKKQLSV